MTKKKYLLIGFIVLCCILYFSSIAISINKRRTVSKLTLQLENAINKHNISDIVKLYPSCCRKTMREILSQSKLDEFYNNVIANGDKVKIEILDEARFKTSSKKEAQDDINQEYNANIKIQDYKLIKIKYHQDFGESELQVIKIKGQYYLYPSGYLGEPISYFVN